MNKMKMCNVWEKLLCNQNSILGQAWVAEFFSEDLMDQLHIKCLLEWMCDQNMKNISILIFLTFIVSTLGRDGKVCKL